MPLEVLGASVHLGGTVVLALFFVLLARHEPRPYLREWTSAWLAQALALQLYLGGEIRRWPSPRGLYLLLETAHGLLLLIAVWTFARGRVTSRTRAVLFLVLAAWAGVAPRLLGTEPLEAAQLAVLAGLSLASALAIRPGRVPDAMGVRLVSHVFALLGLLELSHGAVLLLGAPETVAPLVHLAPLLTLLLQMLLGLGMVLSVMETSQSALARANLQLSEAQQRLRVLADTDALTGCANRHVFREVVDDLRRRGAAGTVLLIDLDGLKVINDRDGHAAGDDAIRATAEAIRSRTRTDDLVVRWGGDEFVVVLDGLPEAEAEPRADAIRGAIRDARLSASVGIARYGPDRDVLAAVHDADARMYEMKRNRRLAT